MASHWPLADRLTCLDRIEASALKEIQVEIELTPIVGIDALVNDSLVGTTLMWGAYINGFLCGVFGYIYLRCE